MMDILYDFEKIGKGWVVLFLVLTLSACEQQAKQPQYPLHYSDEIFGTSFTIKASPLPDSISADDVKLKIKQALDQLDHVMSTYKPDSELSQLNKNHSMEWVDISSDLYDVLKQAHHISVISGGAFDITVGPLVNLWGFGPDPMSFVAPNTVVIRQTLTKIGYQKLLFNDQNQRVKKIEASLYLDLSAIAKGYAVDKVGALLEEYGISHYMVEIGGELRLKGANIKQNPWRIAIEKPSSEQRVIQKVLPLSNISLATSGDYRNFFESEGIRFSHTIDPRSGSPIRHDLASVTVLSETTMKADALATALMVLGDEEGGRMAERENIAALFIIKTKDGFTEKASSSFLEKLKVNK
jgi:thiamine biosynthesis lipoprotein